jgi:hypothetical protein
LLAVQLSPATLLKLILSCALQTDVDADDNPSPASSGSMSGSSRDASSSSGSSLASTLGLGSSSAGKDDHTHKAQEIINRAVSAGVMLQYTGSADDDACEKSSCPLHSATQDHMQCSAAVAPRSAVCFGGVPT